MGRIVLSHTATNLDVRTDGYRNLEMTLISGEWPSVPYRITSVQVIFGQISAYSLKRSLEVYCNSEGVNAQLVRTAALGAYLGATGTVYRNVTFQCATNLNYPALDVINLKCHNESGTSGTGAGFKIYAGSTVQLVIDYELTFQVSPFSLDKAAMDMGQTVTVTIPANDVNSGFTHTATLSMGGQSVTASRTGPGAIQLTVPTSWYSLLPTSVSGTATVTVTTSGVGQTGSAAQSLTLTIPASVKPTAGTLTAEGISQYWGLYVQGVSRATITASGYAAGAGASGVSVSIAGGGYSGTGATLTTGTLKTAGVVTFTATVMDSRGRTATTTASITVTAYALPAISSLTVQRCNASGTVDEAAGTYVKITLGYAWSAIGSNAIDADIYINGTKTNEGVALPASGEAFSTAFGGALAITSAYEIKVMVYDGIHTRAAGANISASATLQSAKRILNFYPSADSGIGIGQMATAEKRVELAEDWELWTGGRDIDGAITAAQATADAALPKSGGTMTGALELSIALAVESGGTGAETAIDGYYGLAYRGHVDNLDTTGQYSGFWVTTPDTLGTWPASIGNKYGVLISRSTLNAQNNGYRIQELHSITDTTKYWIRNRWDASAWTAWYKYSGTADA